MILGAILDAQTLAVLGGLLTSLGGLYAARINRGRALDERENALYKRVSDDNEILRQRCRELLTERDMWRRRAEDWDAVQREAADRGE